jgi:hypothetical protein
MISRIKAILFDKLLTHGWQVPVRLFVGYQNLTSTYTNMSQGGQDAIVLKLLNNKRNGTFVELGGSNGVTSSNSYVLEKKYGWTGLCIEANKRFFKHLDKNRNCKKVNAVVADEAKQVHFNNDGATGGIDEIGEVMQARSLSQILVDQDMPNGIDFLSLDVEGYEEMVLLNFPFDKFRFSIMSIERPSEKLHEKMLSQGYKLHIKLEPNGEWLDNIYVDESL